MNTIILSFCLLFREYFLSSALVLSSKAIIVIDFSGCNERSGRWRSIGWPNRFERFRKRITERTTADSLSPYRARQWIPERSGESQLEIQRSVRSSIGTQHLNTPNCLHSHDHHEPRLRWVLLCPVLPVHLRQGIKVRRDEPIVGHPNPIKRVRVRIDLERYKVHQRFV